MLGRADLSMGAVDKVALGTAGVLHIRQDLHLVGQQFSCECSATPARSSADQQGARR